MLILLAIPTAILVLTLITYRLIKNGSKEFISNLERKVEKMENVYSLSFTRNVLSFFVSSSARNATRIFASVEDEDDVTLNEQIMDMARSIGKDVEKLYESYTKATSPSKDLERIKSMSTLIKRISLLYGLSISSIGYALVIMSTSQTYASLLKSLDGVMLGTTIIFSMVVVLTLIDLMRYSKRINVAMKDVGKNARRPLFSINKYL